MENEYIEETIPENTEIPVENPSDPEILPSDVVPAPEVQETPSDVLPDENISDSPVLEETETGTETTEENGEIENEEIVEMENGNEDFYDSVSGNDIGDGSTSSSGTDDTYVTNFYTMEETEVVPLWDMNISEFSTSEMLLFLIFILLLVQFIHNIFKGSHWLKG